MYAKNRSDLSDNMKAELETMKTSVKSVIPYYKSSTGALKDEAWEEIIKEYQDKQAMIDAKAYLAMMEAASAVKDKLKLDNNVTDDEGNVKNSDLFSAFEGYVGIVQDVLTRNVNLNDIKNMAAGIEGNAIVISATKMNGVLTFRVSPEDANPMTSTSTAGTGKALITECEINGQADSTATLVLDKNTVGTIKVKTQSGGYISSFNNFGITDVQYSNGGTVATFNQSTFTVNALSPGEETITIKRYIKLYERTCTFTIHVTVNP